MDKDKGLIARLKQANTYYLIFISIVSLLFTLPSFIVLYRYVPDLVIDFGEGVRLDHILTFIVCFVVIFSLLLLVNRKFLLGLAGSIIVVISVFQLTGALTVNEIFSKYSDMMDFVKNTPVNIPFLAEEKMTIRNSAKILEAIDFANPQLRSFAVESSIKYFNEAGLYSKYGNLIRYFSIFKTINKWNYVPDPRGLDYFAKASTSSKILAGDCDDHSILMAACIKAVGGTTRLVHTSKHLYPEVLVCRNEDIQMVFDLIKNQLFYKESLGQSIFYHVDGMGNVWLNFDYTASYPGGKFMNDQVIGILEI